MDSSRTPLSPGGRKRRRASPSDELHNMGNPAHQSQTSLPSIRQLVHPYMGDSPSSTGMASHIGPDAHPYAYSSSPHYTSHSGGQVDTGTSHLMGAHQRDTGQYGAGDSEPDDIGIDGPPKKKRRRQALSCTECKRRKIKCDRSQPCTPCTRRGEEAGCQWHIVEPVEKYATKAEFDELKARFAELAALVQRLLPSATAANLPYYPMTAQPGMAGGTDDAGQSFNPGNSGSLGYSSSMMPPPPPPLQQQYSQHLADTTSSQPPNRYMKAEGAASSPTRPPLGVTSASPIMSSALHNAPMSRHRAESSPKSAAAAAKSSALSLSSITSPYNHPSSHSHLQAQPKNWPAQTLILGERLRSGTTEDPATFSARIRPRSAHRRRATRLLRCISITAHLRPCRSISSREARRDGSVIRLRDRHEMTVKETE